MPSTQCRSAGSRLSPGTLRLVMPARLLTCGGMVSHGAFGIKGCRRAGKISRVGCDVLIISGLEDRICPPYMAAL
jgi:hypothetical protein